MYFLLFDDALHEGGNEWLCWVFFMIYYILSDFINKTIKLNDVIMIEYIINTAYFLV
jgi:hypothetical protein